MDIDVVGLGPGSAGLLTAETRTLLASGRPVLLRTRHHPTVADLDPKGRWASCDDLYESRSAFGAVYEAIAQRALVLARSNSLIYAVPGHPLVAEESVTILLRQAAEAGLAVQVHPALSFADLAAVALGRDLNGTQLCDALALRIDAERPALIGQLFDRDVATSLKLALLAIYPPGHEVTLLRALGTAEEEVSRLQLAELDHRATGYLDALYVPPLVAEEDVRRFDGLWAIVERLHAPGGCPWDREQTHASLRPHLLEESYEALEAIDAGDPARLTEELGDVLLQVLMHAAVGEREGTFALADVVEQIARKLVRRHPHVFGEAEARTAEEVYRNWEALKQAEKPRSSVLEGVPVSLPALAASQSIQGRARRVGFDWPDVEGPLEKLREEVEEFARAEGAEAREDEFGDIVFVLANVAQRLGVDAEQALRRANAKFRRRFGRVEAMAAAAGVELADLDLAGLDALWERAKAEEPA